MGRTGTALLPLAFALLPACGLLACGGEEGEGAPEVVDSAAHQRTAATTLRAGMSQDEVRNRLGEPRTRVTMDAGYERWTYYNYDAQGQIAAKTLIIFGDDGKVVEVNSSP